jgi:hypothetical protein
MREVGVSQRISKILSGSNIRIERVEVKVAVIVWWFDV